MIHLNEEIRDEEVEMLDDVGKLRTFLLSIIPLQMVTDQQFFLMRFSDITTKKEYEKEETEKDLVKAAAAIDLVTVMVDKVAPFLDEDDVGRLRSMIADLQLNYAKQA